MFRVFLDHDEPVFGPSYRVEGGAVCVRGGSSHRHRFGGTSWRVVDPNPIAGGPTLLLTLDLADPILGGALAGRMDEIPLCSYLACDVWVEPQLYRVDAASRVVTLIHRGEPATEYADPDYWASFEETPATLEPMPAEDRPETEDAYSEAGDRFMGGGRPIRILGPPLWLDWPTRVECDCGRFMEYFAAVGCEAPDAPEGLIPSRRIYYGEGSLWWFVCPFCPSVAVTSSGT